MTSAPKEATPTCTNIAKEANCVRYPEEAVPAPLSNRRSVHGVLMVSLHATSDEVKSAPKEVKSAPAPKEVTSAPEEVTSALAPEEVTSAPEEVTS